ncbi:MULTISPECIES: outer membrane beta-barrel protein [Hymenobacter]|uniref:outer membrane beta-barrel protein n=1 Tax=Hymenobacter TaxID=89966 RepID=UPI001058C97D|nr:MULTISPECIES: outer membrane beta-barrel protein [Hymenobacter]QIL76424.1 outer membrane beta-barrel protein [Hymenobacter sp. HDW8]
MKKIVFLALLLSLNFSIAQAQISRGTSLIGGSIGYNWSTNESKYVGSVIPAGPNPIELTYQNFNINPNAGYFIADNLAAGLSFGFGTTKEIRPYSESADPARPNKLITKSITYNVAPFLRYYYFPIESFGFYSQLSAGLNHQVTTTTFDGIDNERKSKTNGGVSVSLQH